MHALGDQLILLEADADRSSRRFVNGFTSDDVVRSGARPTANCRGGCPIVKW